jgi:D-alanyl-D-alanine dipeptidase
MLNAFLQTSRSFIFMLFLPFPQILGAQTVTPVKNEAIYLQQVRQDSNRCMVELRSWLPGMVYDLRYARADNFTGKMLYKSGDLSFLRLPAAKALKKVQEELHSKGYELKIFDAYRPHEATVRIWELVGDERYAAHPSKGSHHNRGLAVDLTLICLASGKEVDMGTEFDHFSDTAHHSFPHLSLEVKLNRMLLRNVMEKHGFRALETEWWHYSWINDRDYEVLDVEFEKLKESSCGL